MLSGHQRITRRRNIAENFNRLSRVHERYRRQTDDRQTYGRTTTNSEHEHEFTFAKNSTTIYTAFVNSSNDSTQRVARATVTVGLAVKYTATVMASERRRREPSAEGQL